MNRAKGTHRRGGNANGKKYEGRRHGSAQGRKGRARRAAAVEKAHETKERQSAKREIAQAVEESAQLARSFRTTSPDSAEEVVAGRSPASCG